MPSNLDADQQNIILLVSTFTTLIIAVPVLWAHNVMIPELQQQQQRHLSNEKHQESSSSSCPSSLFLGCIATVSLMALATVILTLPIVSFLSHNDQEDTATTTNVSSSINFCEEDFRHSAYIAEPANVVSSLTSYIPLALLGLVGPPAAQYEQCKYSYRAAYATLLTVGFGSMALHALLTAEAQGGDELPMLFYTAAAAYCAMDVILFGRLASKQNYESWLFGAVMATAITATVTYVARREDFTIFYAMFSIYSLTMVCSVVWITLGMDWEATGKDAGVYFKIRVLFPLAESAAWFTVMAIWVWVSEMLFCNSVMQDRALGERLAPFIWNRVVHPMWHFLSGMLAWLLVQVLLAAHGMQRGWGTPSLKWFGAPYVVFRPSKKIE